MTSKSYKVSVVLPSAHSMKDVEKCVCAILDQTYKPAELLIVDSYGLNDADKKQLSLMCENKCVLNIINCTEKTNPGAARNSGIKKASESYIALIDVMTIPRKNWLNDVIKIMSSNDRVDIVWGSTVYLSGKGLLVYVRDAVYGKNPIRTIPGTVMKNSAYETVGNFLEAVRTGEDSEWMQRSRYCNVNSTDSGIISADYHGLVKISFFQLMKKWLISYQSSGPLEFYKWQRQIIYFILFPYLIFIAYDLNDFLMHWKGGVELYIPHITKAVIIIPFTIYMIFRGIVLPYIRGVKVFYNILPFRFIALFIIGMILDAVKIYAFITVFNKKC